jgi:hypothetical protein
MGCATGMLSMIMIMMLPYDAAHVHGSRTKMYGHAS